MRVQVAPRRAQPQLLYRPTDVQRTEAFKLSSDPFFIEKVRDIVGLYLDQPDRALVLCVDEKSQIQALDRTRPLLPSVLYRWNGAPMTTCATARCRSSPSLTPRMAR